jgi:POT family proton-dependent oligopeptide transporter
MPDTQPGIAPKMGHEFFGHPRGLVVLFVVELWERFSFYGMRALLIIYLTTVVLVQRPQDMIGFGPLAWVLGFDAVHAGHADWQAFASHIYGLYSGFVYFTPLIGGWLADRWFGKKSVIVAGALLVAIGHLILTTHATFLLALFLVILGTGGLKGNIAAQVADLYHPEDGRRERGFSLFYVGINIGATIAPLLCGWLAFKWGWAAAFDATSIGMVAGLGIYIAGQRWLPSVAGKGAAPGPVVDGVTAAPARSPNLQARRNAIALAIISLASIFLWVSYEQQANSLMRWLVTAPDDIMMAWVQAIPPAVVLLGTPVLARWWSNQAKRGREPDPVTKLMIGAAIVVLAQVLLPLLALVSGGHGPSIAPLMVYFVLWEVGDLFFSPAAMGLFSRLAAPGKGAITMAVWYLTVFVGNIASGWIGGLWGVLSPTGYWLMIAGLTALCGVIIAATQRRLRRAVGVAA